ncbi:hypothetical protein [Shewanella sp.]|uniref:hypothetical protein n=1 Tax=Shewanella sp. TaxID=50422 RepID=UPI003A968FB2
MDLATTIAMLGLIFTVVVPLVGWLAKSIATTKQDLSDHKTKVAETYATKDDVRDLGDRLERQMNTGFESIKDLITNRKAS